MSLRTAEGRDFGRECISHLANSGPNLTDTTHSLHGEHVSQKPLIHHIFAYNPPLTDKTGEGREVSGGCVVRVAKEADVRRRAAQALFSRPAVGVAGPCSGSNACDAGAARPSSPGLGGARFPGRAAGRCASRFCTAQALTALTGYVTSAPAPFRG